MKTWVGKVFVLLLLLTRVSADGTAKPWRGLTPTRSTQLDAAQFSEECRTTKIRCGFNLEDAEVMIIFSGGDKSDATCEKLPVGTVLAIKLRFRHLQPFEDFRLRNEKAIVFDPSTPPKSGYKAYYYSKAGLIVSTFKGQVAEVVYVATQEDLQRCAVYYDNPKAFVAVGLTY